MKLPQNKIKLSWKEVKVGYKKIMSSHFLTDDMNLKSNKTMAVKGMSLEQIYQQLANLNKYFLSENLKNINLNSFACKILSLKNKFINNLEDTVVNEDDSESNEEHSEVQEEENCEGEELEDESDIEPWQSEEMKDESDESDDNYDMENTDEEEDRDDEILDNATDEKEEADSDDEIDFDKDTFGDIAIESDGSEQDDTEEVDFDKEPTELDEETKQIMYDEFFDDAKEDDGGKAKFSDFFGDDLEENLTNEVKSTYEQAEVENKKVMREMERENIGEKQWYLSGEVDKASRPEYSVLEENLDFTTGAKLKPSDTEVRNEKIESLILERIKRKAYHSVERKIKPIIDPNDYREKFKIDEKKSTKSLADIYLEDYMKKMEGRRKETPAFLLTGYDAPKEESDVNRQLRYKVAHLFRLLDGLCNKHHTPYLMLEENIIESKAAALSVEEATPITTSDGMMLAPEEIVAGSKRDLKGHTERNITDRKRERRRKKAYQKDQSKKEDANLNKQLKTPDSKSAQAQASVKFVQKAVKRGHVKVLESKQSKEVRTSSAFFKALDEGQPSKKRKIQ